MKVKELKAACKERGLDISGPRGKNSGRKADLVARLKQYVIGNTSTGVCNNTKANPILGNIATKPTVTVASHVPSSSSAVVKNEEYNVYAAVFDLEDNNSDDDDDDDDDKPMASLSTKRKASEDDQKPSAAEARASMVTSTTSLSQTSQTSTSSVGQLTQEQKERIERKREEALRKKRARMMSENSNTITSIISQSPIYDGDSQGMAATTTSCNKSLSPDRKKHAVVNPYLQKSPQIKRDESKPDDTFFKQPEEKPPALTMDDLPPLPEDAPPVREDTLKRLSEQQLQVIMAARPPSGSTNGGNNNDVSENLFPRIQQSSSQLGPHPMIRINAAAGTGKTTTLLHLATRCIDLGHSSLTYLTFSKASAQDAKGRMQAVLDEEHKHCVDAGTLHSCAIRLLTDSSAEEQEQDDELFLIEDHQFTEFLTRQFGDEITLYLQPALHHVRSSTKEEDMHKLEEKEKLLFEKALFYLTKTFKNFCMKKMTLEQLKDTNYHWRHYFPSK